jgi:flagellar hook-associated protein FlgK
MKKIVTILTVAGLFTTIAASSARADGNGNVFFGGDVPETCKVDTVTDGTLALEQGSLSKLVTIKKGEIKVTCNNTGKKLTIAVSDSLSNVFNGAADANLAGGTGVYKNAAGKNAAPNDVVNGDIANVSATIETKTSILAAGTGYSVVVVPTLTP